ncbi:MAG: hypothetical protein LKCHEGNO_00718 [Burkholderiaceae bacterium]|nr:hypothetical protein [Burkholderiaceae bacterium]
MPRRCACSPDADGRRHARTAGAGTRRRHRHRGGQPRRRRGVHRRPGIRRARQGAQRAARPRAPGAPRAPFPRARLRHAEHHPARRRAGGRAPPGVGAVRPRHRRADRAGHGPAADRPATDPAARQHAVRYPHAREGALPAGRGLLQDHPGARTDAAADPRRARAGGSREPRVLHPRRAVRRLLGPVLHQPCTHRPQRQPRQLLAGVPAAVHGDRLAGPRDRAREARAVDQGQRPERQPRGAGRRRRAQLQDRGPLQGPRLCQERHRALPAAARRAARRARRPAARIVGANDLRVHARPAAQLQPRRDRLFRQRPQRRPRRVRQPQARRAADRPRGARERVGRRDRTR